MPRFDWFFGGLLVYLLALTGSSFESGEIGSYLEVLGRWYLLLLLLIVIWYTRECGVAGQVAIIRAWTWGVIVMGALAYLGYGLALSGTITRLVIVYENYPYFGTVYRSSGVCGGPTALVILSILPLSYAWRRWRNGEGTPWLLVFLLPILLLSFSKEIILLGLAIFLVDDFVLHRRWLRYVGVAAIASVYWFGTHYIVQPLQEHTGSYLDGEEFTSGVVVWQGEYLQLLETSYTALKKAAISVGKDHPFWGVGADQFSTYLPAKKAAGIYPEHLPNYIPHSTWFGAIAEAGFIGLFGVLVMVCSVSRRIYQSPKLDVDLCLKSYFIIFAIGAMSMDLLELRFIWIPIGMVLGRQLANHQSAVDVSLNRLD
ncbi:MAG: O-antigen ligase family protein [Lewinella sp.]